MTQHAIEGRVIRAERLFRPVPAFGASHAWASVLLEILGPGQRVVMAGTDPETHAFAMMCGRARIACEPLASGSSRPALLGALLAELSADRRDQIGAVMLPPVRTAEEAERLVAAAVAVRDHAWHFAQILVEITGDAAGGPVDLASLPDCAVVWDRRRAGTAPVRGRAAERLAAE